MLLAIRQWREKGSQRVDLFVRGKNLKDFRNEMLFSRPSLGVCPGKGTQTGGGGDRRGKIPSDLGYPQPQAARSLRYSSGKRDLKK